MPSVSDMVKAVSAALDGRDSLEARIALGDLAGKVAELEGRVSELERENAALREKLAARKKLETRRGESFVLEDDGAETGPVCPSCYRADGIVMILEEANGGARCPRCKTMYPGVRASVEGFKQGIY